MEYIFVEYLYSIIGNKYIDVYKINESTYNNLKHIYTVKYQ